MARLRDEFTREDLPEDKRHYFDAITKSRGSTRLRGNLGILMNAPELGGRIAHVGEYLRYEAVMPALARELTILTVAKEFNNASEWDSHLPYAQRAGAREEAIEVLSRRGPLHQLNEEEALIVAFARELIRDHRVTDATFEAVRAKYGDVATTELAGTVAYYATL